MGRLFHEAAYSMSIALRGKGSDLPVADRPEATATPTTQWGSNQSPSIVSTKMGISAVWAGDFRQILAKVAVFWRLETLDNRTKPL